MSANKILLGAVVVIMSMAAVSGGNSLNISLNTVIMDNMSIYPAVLIVPVGSNVNWINKDSTTHRVFSDSELFDSGDLTTGMSYNYTFDYPGSYAYHCPIHPSMTGTIVVTTNFPLAQSNNNISINTNL